MERHVVREKFTVPSSQASGGVNMMARMVDDFLYVSSRHDDVTTFSDTLHAGVPEYGLTTNIAKTKTNITPPTEDMSQGIFKSECGRSFVVWNGCCINQDTFEVQHDFSRYVKTHLADTLSFSPSDQAPGLKMVQKLHQLIKMRSHPMYYDSQINSDDVVHLNVYQAMLYVAMCFHCIAKELPQKMSVNPKFCLKAILDCIEYFWRKIQSGGLVCPI
eukprot:TRINITY_DN7089_c1_g1_i1.p1 TRINITY_DN7089_c1_g1~~TRINITY_DN7089_c1_g1_i1.p1  ORF type:complete len:217 (-),score=46.44 TRINITY_DN7089_c1_g1_i1:3-653(-)